VGRRVKVETDEAKTDMTPIIDIVFNLLIFFLCATKLRADEGVIRAHLPKTMGLQSGTATQPLNDVRIRLLWEEEQVVVAVGAHRLNAPGRLDAAVWRDLQPAPRRPEGQRHVALGDHRRAAAGADAGRGLRPERGRPRRDPRGALRRARVLTQRVTRRSSPARDLANPGK
jgi:Biopolymer transport protein ExbD/TolR